MLILVQSPYLQREIEPGKSFEMQFFILKKLSYRNSCLFTKV